MSEAGDPPAPDASDWFRGRRASESASESVSDLAPRAPRPVGEAFGHLRRADGADGAAGESDWFDAGDEQAADGEGFGTLVEMRAGAAASPPAETGEPAAEADRAATAAGSGPAAPPNLDSASDPDPDPDPDRDPAPTPEPDGRVRLRALTGGLADLSDALAAIGVESVALRSQGPARPAPPPQPQPPSAADFRVRCPDCGPQYVAVSDLRFVETGDGAEANRYLFTCPACGARVRRPAGPELAAILKSSGVATLALRRGPGQAL
ncbi:putative RNA-binding Zn-ribbon protein involved in translation (DUF1610 family) [Catenulispora sp. GP43]|uniref:zinc ribbon domain-containing protein n=1 Tax=Catenulispora sp. GP43 TaxID=3156263 RepID=UPI00351144F0